MAVAPDVGTLSVPLLLLFATLALGGFLGGARWVRERGLSSGRSAMQRLCKLGEELETGRSPVDSLQSLRSVLIATLDVTDVDIYLLDRPARTFRRVKDGSGSAPAGLPILSDDPVGFRERTMSLCHRNRSLVAVPDSRRSPFYEDGQNAPRSAIFVPMLAGDDLVGILELSHAIRVRAFSSVEQMALQHLANETAMGIRLLEERSLRERAAGGDEARAAYSVLAASAGKLQRSLASIEEAAQRLRSHAGAREFEEELAEISAHAHKGAAVITQVLNMLTSRRQGVRSVDVVLLLRRLVAAREASWKRTGIRTVDLLGEDAAVVAAPSGCLEQVFESLLWYAENSAGLAGNIITIRAAHLGTAADVEISWGGLPPEAGAVDPFDNDWRPSDDVLSLAVCRDLIRECGGKMSAAYEESRGRWFDVVMPLARQAVPAPDRGTHATRRAVEPLTALVADPDSESQQALISFLGEKGHRAVPAASVEEAIDLVRRFRFDVLFCSEGSAQSWVDCFSKTRDHLDAFVVLTQDRDPGLVAALPAGEVYVLAKPARPEELSGLLEELGARVDRTKGNKMVTGGRA